MTTSGYAVAEIGEPDDDAPCACGSCRWRGPASATAEIGDCALDPGDASPVGRCPACGDLAYLDRPVDRAREHAAELLDLLQRVLGCAELNQDDLTPETREIVQRAGTFLADTIEAVEG